jgi:O-antigen ligase
MQLKNRMAHWDFKKYSDSLSWEFGVILSLFCLIGVFNKTFTYIGFHSIYIVEFTLAGLCVSLLIRESATVLKHYLIRKENLLFGLLFLLGLIHWGCSLSYGLAALRYGMIVFYFLLFGAGFQLAITREAQIRILLYAILTVSTFINAVKILVYQFSHAPLNAYEQFRVYHNEVDVLGAAFSVIIIMALFKKFHKILALICLGLNLILIFLSARRTAVLGLAICATVYFMSNYQKVNLKKLGMVALTVGGIGVILILAYYWWDPQHSTAYYDFLIQRLNILKENNSTWRMEAWKIAWDKFSGHPIRGIGFGKPIIDIPIRNVNTYDPHNSFLALLVRTGIGGGIVLVGLIIQSLALYLKEYHREVVAERKQLILILFLTLIFMIVFACFNVILENQYQGIYFYFSLSGIYIIRNIRFKGENSISPAKAKMGWITFTILAGSYFGLIAASLIIAPKN